MDKVFDFLKDVFNKNGYRLYMIGSTSRDYLLGRPIKDYDFVTNAKPDEIKEFLKCDLTFAKYGCVKYKFDGKSIDIVTLRKESNYTDSRHPDKVEFVDDLYEDYKRRDLTINAIYIDENYDVLRISSQGYRDLIERKLRFIGEPKERIEEDPLRILRAKRFMIEYNLEVDDNLLNLLQEKSYLLDKINKAKIEEEKRKLDKVREEL